MKISPEKLQLSMLNQMAQGKTPHPDYYEELGASKSDIDRAITDMRDQHLVVSRGAGWGTAGGSKPSDELENIKITVDGRNYLSKHFEITAAYRDLEE